MTHRVWRSLDGGFKIPLLRKHDSIPNYLGCPFSVLIIAALLFAFTTTFGHPAYAQQRRALVIGNWNYFKVSSLVNPRNDARQIVPELRNSGFHVLYARNLSLKEMNNVGRRLLGDLKSDDTVLFYYSGHGIQVDSRNYLVPVDANLYRPGNLRSRLFALNEFVDELDQKTAVAIVLLDACRNLPQAPQLGLRHGLARMPDGNGLLVHYATNYDRVASEGVEYGLRVSPFTHGILEFAFVRGLEIELASTEINRHVQRLTQGRQIPIFHSSIPSHFFLRGKQ